MPSKSDSRRPASLAMDSVYQRSRERCYRESGCYRISSSNLVILFVYVLFAVTSGAASTGYVDDKVQNYLMNFGYLPQSNSETGNLRSEDQLKEAIISLQEFGHIPVTGKIDERTKELLSSLDAAYQISWTLPEEDGTEDLFSKELRGITQI